MMIVMKRQQEGMALATAMIFLIVLSIIGVTAMRNTTLEQNMSSNMQDLNHSFQLAESGIVRRSREASLLDTTRLANNPIPAVYTSVYDDADAPIALNTESFYRGEGLPKGDTLESINSINTTSEHVFHIQSVGRYNNSVSTHGQGITILGPKTN